MIDREKVIKGLEYHLKELSVGKTCSECPYCGDNPCEIHLVCDALELLKKQNPVIVRVMTKVERMINAFLQYPNYTVGEGEDSTTFLEVINYLADQVPRVLSLEQLRALEGTDHFVWVENNGDHECVDGYAEVTSGLDKKDIELFTFGSEVKWTPNNDCYGETWRCWNLKPDKDQMENTPWE